MGVSGHIALGRSESDQVHSLGHKLLQFNHVDFSVCAWSNHRTQKQGVLLGDARTGKCPVHRLRGLSLIPRIYVKTQVWECISGRFPVLVGELSGATLGETDSLNLLELGWYRSLCVVHTSNKSERHFKTLKNLFHGSVSSLSFLFSSFPTLT